jgi:hypothetical protein
LASATQLCSKSILSAALKVLERIQAMLSELREVAWLAGISILSIPGIGVAVGVALVAFA